jgi:hypothetical protein
VQDTESSARRKAVGGASVADVLGKTNTADEMASWPPGLADYVKANNVPPAEARMLAGINTRGRTPTKAGDWKASTG